MTSGVKQALPQIVMQKPNADRQGLRSRAGDHDFGEALGIAKKAKQEISGKLPADAEQRWPRFGTKLDAAIDSVSRLGSKLSLKVPDQLEARQATDEEALARDEIGKRAAAEDAGAAIPLPLPAIHVPPVQARRAAGTGEEETPYDAQADESDGPVAAAPRNPGDSWRSAAPVDDITGEGNPSAPPIGHDGKSRDRPRDNANSSPVMDIASADARPAAATSEQASKPLFARPASAPKVDDNAAVNPEHNHPDAAKAATRVTILSEQNFPAPLQATTLVLAESIASSGIVIPAADRPAVDAIQASIAATSAQSLKIQLHPAELGMVTATLRFVGQQLSIELKVENNEAYRRLNTDSEMIVKSLRGLGYEIDRVTVVQPSIVQNTPARPDGTAGISAQPGRGGEQFGSGATGGGNAGTGGQQPGTGRSDARHGGEKHHAGKPGGADSGLYI